VLIKFFRAIGIMALTLLSAATVADDAPRDERALSGGALTVFDQTSKAFGQHAPNLPIRELRNFTSGNRLFNTNWVTAPASVKSLDGLGPLFNRVSCSACHTRDGRGIAPEGSDEPLMSILLRLSAPGETPDSDPVPHSVYGGQLNDRAILGVKPEGRASITWHKIEGQYPDGAPYELRRPEINVVDLAYGPLGENTLTSLRVAPAVFGVGLLEAIDESTILALADPNDADGDGISGRPNYVHDVTNDKTALGRFGWKANQPSVRQQSAGAALGDVGITTSMFPDHGFSKPQVEAQNAPTGDDGIGYEMTNKQLDKMTFYMQTLAVPARRNVNDPTIRRGEELFAEMQCAKCHTPSITTGVHPTVPVLSNQKLQPFTDLLLHDMGEELADYRPDFLATGTEWRTPPLWGIGLNEIVRLNGPRRKDQKENLGLMHDGRAKTIEEAILWHGGEAENALDAFKQSDVKDRAALIAFLYSL